ncbi:MAG: hypothetical protein WDW38_001539 [Sanguina aurantia]
MADDAHAEALANFMAITGADEGEARGMLDACDWVLEQALDLHLSLGEGAGGGGTAVPRRSRTAAATATAAPPTWNAPPPAASNGDGPRDTRHGGSSSSDGGRRSSRRGDDAGDYPVGGSEGFGGFGGGNGGGHGDEEEVRAPIASRVERLYDPTGPAGSGYSPAMMAAMLSHRQAAQAGPAESIVDAFGDFKSEGGSGGGSAEDSNRLSGMFKAPSELLFKGSFEQAKQVAGTEGRWLLVNIQSADEFGSYQLNRDTWRHEAVQGMLTGTFVFYQVQEKAPEGKRLMSLFNLRELPAILIVDPVTGAKLYDRSGFVDAETLMEALVPFLDAGPNDAGAASMALPMKRRAHHTAAGSKSRVPLTEDEEMALAIAQSMGSHRDTGHQQDSNGPAPLDDDDIDEAAIYEQIRIQEEAAASAAAAAAATTAAPAGASARTTSKPSSSAEATAPALDPLAQRALMVQQVQQAAAARLAPEPEGGTRVPVRLPGGSRSMRRFDKGEKVSALYDWCVSISADLAAAVGRFTLSIDSPGAASVVFSDHSLTLDAAGVFGSMLTAKISS